MINRNQLRLAARAFLMLALLALALSGLWTARRADLSAGQERYDQMAGVLDATHTLEQTFTAGRNDLGALEVYPLIPPGTLSSNYTLTLSLSEIDPAQSNAPASDFAVTWVPLVDARSQKKVTLTFPPRSDSQSKIYRLLVETNAPADTVTLLASAEDAYFDGELLLNGQPTGRDLAFRAFTAVLNPLTLAAEIAVIMPDFARLLLLALLFSLAGASFLSLLGVWPEPSAWERALWSLGTGLALTPLIYLLAGRYTAWVLAALFVMATLRVFIRWIKARSHRLDTAATGQGKQDIHTSASVPQSHIDAPRPLSARLLEGWPLLLLFLWSLVVRLLQIRDIPVPMWTDGLSHIQMAQSILDAGRMPAGLLYHIGFHTQVALVYDWLNLPLPRVIVLFGQLISALSGPALYVLVWRIHPNPARSRPAALLAALLLATVPSLPGYLINWGRYPFLLGLTLLPFALAATIDALRQKPAWAALPRYGLLLCLLAGLFLSHYGMASFWLTFTLLFLVIERPAWLRDVRWYVYVLGVLALLALAVLAGSLRFGDDLFSKLASTINESRQVSEELNYATIRQLNLRAGGLWLVIGGTLGALWAGLRARRLLALSAGWFALQAVLIAIQSPLFGYALASYANLLLALSLPLAALAGSLLADGLFVDGLLADSPQTASLPSALPLTHSTPMLAWNAAQVVLIALLALSGGLTQVGILNPTSLMYSPADRQAVEWIQSSTAPNARFLINSHPWTGGKVIPSDGGGWITTLTGRPSVFLTDRPQLTGLNGFITQEQVAYVYLGRFSGLLARARFDQSPQRYQHVYHQGGIDIYAVINTGP